MTETNVQIQGPAVRYAVYGVALVAAFAGGMVASTAVQWLRTGQIDSGSPLLTLNDLDLNYIDEVVSKINANYLGDPVDAQAATYGTVRGLVESFDDPYTNYLTPEQSESYFQSANNEFEGVGITLVYRDSTTVIESVLEGQPAEAAGIESGDYINTVNGEEVIGLRPYEVADKIKGESGTEVDIEVYRPSVDDLLSFTVTRASIDLPNIDWEWSEQQSDIAIIRIYRFTEDSVQAFNRRWDEVVDEVVAAGAAGVIVDLRNNPGGYVDSVIYVAEEFLPSGTKIMSEETKGGRQLTSEDNRVGSFETIPVSVMVNRGSASASEIFAAAMQDNERAQVIGTETVGKGVEQKLVELSDGGLLTVVFRRWLTPNGINIDSENPIQPDIMVEEADQQVETALKALE